MRTFSQNSSSQGSFTHYNPSSQPTITLTAAARTARAAAAVKQPLNDSLLTVTTSPNRTTTTTKCATVTMMLAERIVRNDWSVEDEHFFDSNNMNVWQTLEFLSGLNTRKRYNYEGYNDVSNSLRTLTPSWRRDSFVEKNVNPNGDESNSGPNRKYSTVASTGPANNSDNALANNALASDAKGLNGSGGGAMGRNKRSSSCHNKNSKNAKGGHRKRKDKQKNIVLDSAYALSPSDYSDLIKCTFTLPRISAALERLMGTNVVRLTDRNYMKELRERIDDDYRTNLQKRIRARELKEVERERILIIEGKTDDIPYELADDPIFVVDKKADFEIKKARAKLKTNREKNAERLKLQGVKWEQERLQHEEEERQRINILRERYREQKTLEGEFQMEDAHKGMDLLRIDNEDWRPCEQELKEFLQTERDKMKERSLRIPTPFSSDPKDINNILKARKKFRDVERRIRKAIENDQPQSSAKKELTQQLSGQRHGTGLGCMGQTQDLMQSPDEPLTVNDTEEPETATTHKHTTSDDASDISSGGSMEEGSSISLAKQRYADMLQQELEHDVNEGFLISKDQYDHLRYEDEKIIHLRNAKDIRELYLLAEEIIIGDRIQSVADEEEVLAEEQENSEEHEAVAEHNK